MNNEQNCPHCGAENNKAIGSMFNCGNPHAEGNIYRRTALCLEREARQKAEKELAETKRQLESSKLANSAALAKYIETRQKLEEYQQRGPIVIRGTKTAFEEIKRLEKERDEAIEIAGDLNDYAYHFTDGLCCRLSRSEHSCPCGLNDTRARLAALKKTPEPKEAQS